MVPGGEDSFLALSPGQPLDEAPGWTQPPDSGVPTDIVGGATGGIQSGASPTTDDVIVFGPNPVRTDRVIGGELPDVTSQVGMIGVFLSDPDNFIAIRLVSGTLSILEKLAGVETTLVSGTPSLSNGDTVAAVVRDGQIWLTANGGVVGSPSAFDAFFTNQAPGVVVRNPSGVDETFLSIFSWARVHVGYGYGYGLSYGQA